MKQKVREFVNMVSGGKGKGDPMDIGAVKSKEETEPEGNMTEGEGWEDWGMAGGAYALGEKCWTCG
eukprot:10754950-Karenia_brevis.AAC.1